MNFYLDKQMRFSNTRLIKLDKEMKIFNKMKLNHIIYIGTVG